MRAHGGHKDGVAIGCRTRDSARRNRAVGPGFVVEHDWLLERPAQRVADDACGRVDAAADGEGHHERDCAARIILRRRRAGQYGRGKGRDEPQKHAAPGQRGQAYCRIFR